MTNIKYNVWVMVYTLLASEVPSAVLGPMSMINGSYHGLTMVVADSSPFLFSFDASSLDHYEL